MTFRELRNRLGAALRRTFVSIPTPSLVAAAYAAQTRTTDATAPVTTAIPARSTRTGALRVA